MQFSTLKIERFGARSNLQLIDLSDHLNVVYGPNGSGKTTIINFIRWMLYGNPDGTLNRYLSDSGIRGGEYHASFPTTTSSAHDPLRAAGELTVRQQAGLVQRILRQADGTGIGRVSIADANGATGSAFGQTRLTDVDLDEYRTIFSFGFDQSPPLENVVQTARSHGFELSLDERRLDRVQQLTEQLNRQRAELTRYSHFDIAVLVSRRDAIHGEIANLEARKMERLADIERQRSEILAQIEQRRSQLSGIESWLQQVDGTIQIRRAQLEAATREAEMARDNFEESRSRKIEEIDRQIQQWHQVLDSIRSRYEELKSKHVGSGDRHPNAYSFVDDESDLRCLMGKLGYHVDDLEQDMAQLYHFEDQRDVDTKYEYLRGIMGTALQAMRADVTRLTDQLRRYKSTALHHEYESEQKHLRRCEQELSELIVSLSKRRESLSSTDISYAPGGHGSNVGSWIASTRIDSGTVSRNTDYRLATESIIRPWYESPLERVPLNGTFSPRPSEPATASLGYRVDPVLEARLYHLQVRRDQIVPRVNELNAQIRELESRRGYLDAVFSDEDRRIEQLRHELGQIDEQMRLAYEYDRMVKTIRLTEEELVGLRADLGSSVIMQEASAILSRMTCGKHRGIRVLQNRQVVIDDATGRSSDYAQASRGTRDQAYLAICLALVAAYKRRNVQHPLILNDVFINIDKDRAIATAEVLSEFARHGHQVILFTRHERVMELFPARNAKIFTLGSRLGRPPETVSPISPVQPRPVFPEPIVPAAPPVAKRRIVEETNHEWVSHWEMPKPKTADQQVERKTPPAERPVLRHTEATDSDAIESSIGLGSPLDTVPTIDVNLARHFRDIGVVTIGQFLELDPDDASSRLAKHRIRTDQVTRWQSEISLQVYLCISGNDARILVECGISDPEDLAIADLDHLHRRISGFLNSDEARNRYQPFSSMDRDTLARWIEMSRRSNYRRHQRRSERDADSSRQREPRTRTRPERQISTNRRRETPVTLRPRTTSVRPPEPNRSEESEATNGESLKFYLNMEDSIVDAPSIGPKTAERFNTVGINTVADFLAADPIATAEQINYRRVTAEIISEWQIQAKLATQIPNLRGHDAQILAACEVTDADELTRADASTLFKRVKRFVSTTEGKRILRNGKRPDQNEVSDWIRWSEDARQLEVA